MEPAEHDKTQITIHGWSAELAEAKGSCEETGLPTIASDELAAPEGAVSGPASEEARDLPAKKWPGGSKPPSATPTDAGNEPNAG